MNCYLELPITMYHVFVCMCICTSAYGCEYVAMKNNTILLSEFSVDKTLGGSIDTKPHISSAMFIFF